MKSKLYMLAGLCLSCLLVRGQASFTTHAYHDYDQLCHMIGVTNNDKVLELLSDSTIIVSTYKSSFRDHYKSVRKLSYTGRFSRRGDTLFVTYAGYREVVKSENRTDTVATAPISYSVFYPPSVIVISDEKVTGVDKPLDLQRIAVQKAGELALRFQFWDKRMASGAQTVFGFDK
ncbi:MAG: hypothetical protein ABW019_02140 [Chitinophagaceae bacterium]